MKMNATAIIKKILSVFSPELPEPPPPLPDTRDVSGLLFHPRHDEWGCETAFRAVELPVGGATLRMPLFPDDSADGDVVVFFHGNGETAGDWTWKAREMSQAFGASVLFAEYRGYGKSDGSPSYATMLSDAEVLFRSVRDGTLFGKPGGVRVGKVHVFGRSIGSAPAIHVVWKFGRDVASLVIDSGFARLPALIERLGKGAVHSPPLPRGFRDNADKLRETRVPTLFLHGGEDGLIPIEAARENFNASASPQRRLIELPGAGHNNTLFASDYFRHIGDFLAQIPKLAHEDVPFCYNAC